MVEFHQSMLQMTLTFMRTQEHVMLAYLETRRRDNTFIEMRAAGQPMKPGEQHARDQVIPLSVESADLTSRTASTAVSLDSNREELNPKEVSTACETELMFSECEALVTAFIDLVSQRTGYPHELLDPELDLESDLGIDSIKRIEILNNFRRLLPESMQLDLELEELAGLRTLHSIYDWIRKLPLDL